MRTLKHSLARTLWSTVFLALTLHPSRTADAQAAAVPVVPTDGLPVFFPDGVRIAFQATRADGVPRIHAVNIDGSGEHSLTAGSAPEMSPVVSPDGKRILFARILRDASGPPKSSLWVVEADGSNPQQLCDLFLCQSGTWSPDGRRIAFVAGKLPAGPPSGPPPPGFRPTVQIFVMNADGSSKVPLISGDTSPYQIQPNWSADGRRIAYATIAGPRILRLMLVNADGTGPRALGNAGDVLGEHPKWSPDGKTIAYWQPRDTSSISDIYVINPDGTNKRRLTDSRSRNEVPSWSPDGRRLAFQSDRDGAMAIYVMNADGTGVRRVRP